MIRKALILLLTTSAMFCWSIWFALHQISQRSALSVIVLPIEWGDPDGGTYRKVVFSAVRGTFSAYWYVQGNRSRPVRLFEHRLGPLRAEQSVWGGSMRYHSVSIDGWAAAALLMIYPTLAFIRGPLRRWRRRRKGLCIKCGYDLTGNESGVCPECGTAI